MRRVWLIVGLGIVALGALVFWLSGARPDVLAAEDNQIRLTYLLLLLVLLGSGLAVRWRNRPSLKWLQHGLIWAALGLALIAGYSYRGEVRSLWTRLVAEVMPGRAVETAAGTAMIRAGEDSHFRIDATVDGTPVRFLLDTGASVVVLSRSDAARLGFSLDRLTFSRRTETANGVGMGAPVRLREIRIGPIVVRDIAAMVNEAPMSMSLLGVNFLERLSGYSVRDGTLTLRQ